ncbi:MAG: acetyl-CoA hydrolase/transferase C-terminal domain-containing protein [Dehalococcoidales bacterium]|nr:acetyl-CoA hydrolase/transferase C-terminal domain-containing protein [Dehalococcoidales bacterium]
MDWQEEYKQKLTSAEEAMKIVKSGDRVVIPMGREPQALGLALAMRRDELKNVEVLVSTIGIDFGWYDPGWEDSFTVRTRYVYPRGIGREWMDRKQGDYVVSLTGLLLKGEIERPHENRPPDVALIEISTPDEHGFCSFGASVWDKKEQALIARHTVAEVNANLIRTGGDNYIHVSQVDAFVEHTPSPKAWSFEKTEVSDTVKAIAGFVSTLVKDRDTVQIGLGRASYPLVDAGAFDDKHDLGIHSEVLAPGLPRLIESGVVTGKYKTLHKGKVVATACGGARGSDMRFYNNNPIIELYASGYVNNVRTIASHENMVSINNALCVDLTGQVASESMGPRMYAGPGGQTEFAIGAALATGGRSIIVLPSTAEKGTVSRIVPMLEQGTIVTVPRTFVDYVVTEHGVARLWGKSQRQRAVELIAIAHPDFRAELKKASEELYG